MPTAWVQCKDGMRRVWVAIVAKHQYDIRKGRASQQAVKPAESNRRIIVITCG